MEPPRKRHGGRPRLDPHGRRLVPLYVRLSATTVDRLSSLARQRRTTVTAVIRGAVAFALRHARDQDADLEPPDPTADARVVRWR